MLELRGGIRLKGAQELSRNQVEGKLPKRKIDRRTERERIVRRRPAGNGIWSPTAWTTRGGCMSK
ncbi:hypothetical protein CVD25_15375 [Bacillus canaveralius]|uniref:Uncharacterized protein n=1 Tax=Bacillus canaveralius TaxID=1403243 RepID=A0A2N5GK89_9BACI|nr:hypothetical protein [Bacillus canaveralius]PLR81848.1 hypothetical protein CU635_13900 [Bacillus canaveralius]PLR95002.1 hypothetical protein CVD25_15375 [Bacillus canaveralius]